MGGRHRCCSSPTNENILRQALGTYRAVLDDPTSANCTGGAARHGQHVFAMVQTPHAANGKHLGRAR